MSVAFVVDDSEEDVGIWVVFVNAVAFTVELEEDTLRDKCVVCD
jgi:hypothetical protein